MPADIRPSKHRLTRRQLLTGIAGVTVTALAGCSGSGSGGSATRDCQTHALAHGDGDVLDAGASATVDGKDVRLTIPLSVDGVRTHDVEALDIYDGADDLMYTIPVSADDADVMANKVGVNQGQLLYEQYLGHRPFHGQYQIVARDSTQSTIDSVTIEFNCFAEVQDE